MTGNNILGIIYSNKYDECLSEITGLRTMGSVPFAGRYRLIDFALSNMVNSGIEKVGVITKSNYQSLMDHRHGQAVGFVEKNRGYVHFAAVFLGGQYGHLHQPRRNVARRDGLYCTLE